MRNLAVCGSSFKDRTSFDESISVIEMNGVPVTVGLIETSEPAFEPGTPENASSVLLKVKACSCNYRDKSLIFKMAVKGPPASFYVLGSEFMGEVVAIGQNVERLDVGDRVIGDGAYPEPPAPGVKPGLPTNNGSKEYQVLHESKLIRIPDAMPDEVGAAFQIGAQTVYSMIRRANLRPGENVLVTSARSNTSLFAVRALCDVGVDLYATSTAAGSDERLKGLDVKQVIAPGESHSTDDRLGTIASAIGGFDVVLDPFFDLHLDMAVRVMAAGGRYITCGVYDQYLGLTGQQSPRPRVDADSVMRSAILKNLSIIGNCLGSTDDLQRALVDYENGRLPVVIDSVHGGSEVAAFINRTYNDPGRFGKVIFRYD